MDDVRCWRAANFTPGLRLVADAVAARSPRTNAGCVQRHLVHGCGLRTYAYLLDAHEALLAAAGTF